MYYRTWKFLGVNHQAKHRQNEKNSKRTGGGSITPRERKKIGRRCDAIVRRLTAEHDHNDEFGVSKVAKKCDPSNTKVLNEYGLKLPKTFARYVQLSLSSSYPTNARQLETVGTIQPGLHCCLLRTDSPVGFFARSTRVPEEHWLTLTTNVNRFTQQALPLIFLAWHAKEIVSKVLKMITDPSEDNDNDDSSWLDNAFATTPVISLPQCSTSDEGRSK
ncbi:hypothetical protein BC941DRAFT_475000 [Chlamydoabsidia padenii]|nr:hypothetical protein BC941DRAFT_475000 [Chlamydoabsidia padenii]